MNTVSGISAQELRNFIEKIENLEEEKKQISEDIKEVMAHAKSEGFDLPTLREVIRMRKMKREELIEREELLDLYTSALGMSLTPVASKGAPDLAA